MPKHCCSAAQGCRVHRLTRMAAARPHLTKGPIAPALIQFSLLVLGTHVLQSWNGAVNRFMGRHRGDSALRASGNANLGLVFGSRVATRMLVRPRRGPRRIGGGFFWPCRRCVFMLLW